MVNVRPTPPSCVLLHPPPPPPPMSYFTPLHFPCPTPPHPPFPTLPPSLCPTPPHSLSYSTSPPMSYSTPPPMSYSTPLPVLLHLTPCPSPLHLTLHVLFHPTPLSYFTPPLQVGWIHFRRYPGLPLKVLRWIYVMVLTLMIFITFAIQIAICYQRDGFRIMLSPSQSNVTTCDADNHVVMTIVLDLLLIGSYWFGIYLFSGQGDSEHLFSLVSRVSYPRVPGIYQGEG